MIFKLKEEPRLRLFAEICEDLWVPAPPSSFAALAGATVIANLSASNVLVTLFDDRGTPTAGWMFLKAYPVRWATSDLDAKQSGIVIDTMELAYTRMQILRL